MKILNDIFWALFSIVFVILFYLSIKRCFWKGDKSRVVLFIIAFFTGPLIVESVLGALGIIAYTIFNMDNIIANLDTIASGDLSLITSDYSGSLIVYLSTAAAELILVFCFSFIVGKWLGVKRKTPVVFVYSMFYIIHYLAFIPNWGTKESSDLSQIINVLGYVVSIISIGLFYWFVIKKLIQLSQRDIELDWKTFLIPPAMFFLTISIIIPFFYFNEAQEVKLMLYGFMILLVFLFIWVFSVLIKNIKATGDATTARDEVKTLSVEVMEALAHTIDAKDEYTKGHSVRVAQYSRMIAQRMGLSAEECENIYYMGLLHDIGKIGVPNEIINSKNKLTDEEYNVIKTHPGLGFDILAEIKSRPDLSIGARWHHERFDGKGYPDLKPGEEVPIQARIISVADSYDAMTSNRSYRNYLPQDKVRDELKKNAGTQFDPVIVEAMLQIMDEDVYYTLHEQTPGDTGVNNVSSAPVETV